MPSVPTTMYLWCLYVYALRQNTDEICSETLYKISIS